MTSTTKRLLVENNWSEVIPGIVYSKGYWTITADTGSWWEIATASNPRVFDIPAPSADKAAWTLKLIEHLCSMEDEKVSLQNRLEEIFRSTEDVKT